MRENNSKTQIDDTQNLTISKEACSSSSRRPIVQNFLLIWLNDNISTSDSDYQNKTQQLLRIVNDINLFTNLDECVAFLEGVRKEKAYIITSWRLGQKLVPLIHSMAQLGAIYIFCDDPYRDKKWMQAWPKIEGVYSQIELICEAFELAVKQYDRDSIAISLPELNENVDYSLNLNQLEPSFMYTQLFKNTLLNMEHNEREMQQMVNYCREIYARNPYQLKLIDEFGRNYRADKAIWWYTREGFTYQPLNRAFRLLEADIIVNMGFYMHDLHRQIEQLHMKQVREYGGEPFVVYRGQGLSTTDFERLRKNQGGLMAFNGFLSTSKDKIVSLAFAESISASKDMIGILFVMVIDPNITQTPFANIKEESYFKTEEEILFTMHTVFRIVCVRCLDDTGHLFEVQMSLTVDDDTQLRALTERFVEEFQYSTGWYRMGRLLLQVGNVEKAEELYNALLSQSLDEKDEASYNHQLGAIKHTKGDYNEALRFYEKSLETWERTLPENYPNLAACYNSIASVYDDIGKYSEALAFYEKTLNIKQAHLPENHPEFANSYHNIGGVYHTMGEQSKALLFYERALQIRQTALPTNHPSLAKTYNQMGSLYDEMQKYVEALSFHEKALNIKQTVLPANHPDLAVSYNNLGCVYQAMEKNSKAIYFFEKTLQIWRETLPENHPSLGSFYGNIGAVHNNMGEYSKALFFYEKALNISQTHLPENHPNLAISYNNIGGVCASMKMYSKALSFYEKALDIWQKAFPTNYLLFGISYTNIGAVYSDMGEYSKALFFYEKALNIRQRYLPENHPDLAISYNNIGLVYYTMGESSKALSLYAKALDMWEKTPLGSHSSLGTLYNNTGLAYTNMGEHLNALPLYEKALDIYQKTLPANHLSLAYVYRNIGMAYTNMGEYSNALPFYEKTLDIHQKTFPINYPALADAYSQIGVVYSYIGEYDKAHCFFKKSLFASFKHIFLQIVPICTMFLKVSQF